MDSESMFPEMGLGMILFYIAVMVVFIIAEWRIYEKGGQPGWAVLIPFYNIYVLLKLVGRPGWWLLLLLIPVVNLIVAIIVINDLSKSFGQGVGFTLGLIFLTPIFLLLLGFGDFKYVGKGALM
jgi:hypothetical protein